MLRFHRAQLAAVAVAACLSAGVVIAPVHSALAQSAGQKQKMTTASGLVIEDIQVGTGASPKPGQICVMHYTGWLYVNEIGRAHV